MWWGRLNSDSFMPLQTNVLSGNCMTYRDARVSELKEVSGNRDVSQGGTTSGLTAASAIAALQEAGSKLSRDMLKSAYRAFAKECYLIIELMRQFYDEQRVYRITGESGGVEYATFSAQMLRGVPGGVVGGVQLGAHEPVFDIVDGKMNLQYFAATEATAASGRNREPRLGPWPAGHECRSRHEVDAGSRNPWGTFMLQLFAEGEAAPPALSEAQTRQAVASGTMKPDKAKEAPAVPQASAEKTVELQPEKPRQELPVQRPELPPLSSFARSTQAAVHSLHARWAAEEAAMRRSQPDFDLQNELRSPEMRRLMQLPGMRVRDAYRLAHYDENLRTAAQAVEQGVVERIQQRAARPTENGIRPGGAATVRPDVASMTRAQREALERRVLHGAQIEL